ncbi:DUF4335 domain-containing protein [Trichormus azollae]|jgi:hypothetical protein|uniref:DUF4335 domain-containing protein n=1 Tax=Nostoc azollae (strain 0708) TaxID=551115 RepID=D7DXL1_NOSA0|nr:DUF4335 domain-containing protein [Trichormus azollae]ADI64287.1 conserved hypothetical protein ['Nostoc azollae' 0708]
MNIQRKYSLPNCTLLLEGLSDVTISTHFQELRPELSILVNAECYLSSYSQPIAGGREFFESLVRAVSAYAQEFLSNVPNPQAHNRESELVELHKIDTNHHKLIVHSEIPSGGLESQASNEGKQPAIQVDLTTVQLFDLVEAVDQFFADSQTLPELSLELQPVTRRYGGSSQGVFKQVVSASVGISSLAVAAVAFSLIPPPQVRPPERKSEEQTSTTIPTASPTPTIETASTASPIALPTRTTSALASVTPIIKDLEALVNSVPEITDPSQLRALNRQVYNQIHPVWSNRSEFREDLIYRLGVAADGSIIGYKAVNKGSNEAVNKTPLPKILYNPATRNITKEPIAQFRVVFTKLGVLEVSPWRGYVKTPEVIGEKITDSSTVKDLNQKLYNTIRQNWSATPTFSKDLKYRVAVNKGGVIADYEPLNQVAFDFFRETPLPQMFQSVYGSNLAAPNNKEALAHFQVIFKPSGTLEVQPWEGYR